MRYELKVLITWVNPRSWGGKGSWHHTYMYDTSLDSE
jgi:hypothetical protein